MKELTTGTHMTASIAALVSTGSVWEQISVESNWRKWTEGGESFITLTPHETLLGWLDK